MKITLLRADDWEGLFINGECCTEGHHITADDVLRYVCNEISKNKGVTDIDYSIDFISQEWMENEGSFPQYLEEIPDEAYEL